ncbi:hypothetical protein K490DRAFT_48572 [Saccharata proteae CBS 121410]|uniref:F-box domain-containing protein n=1 Tax=Saccharata proteae CBS 121410 TaxID=1314787 RepID=A0A9P4HRR0_9PEZI|nr:hypothetical protein K490DRAFT_48572 [Saccharata proteae CBS 121410]
MVKRTLDESEQDPHHPPSKRLRVKHVDRLSVLSDELVLRVLSYVSVSTLNTCQRVSHRFHTIASDSQLWKAAYYDRFVRPRASRIPGIKDPKASSDNLLFSSKLSKWLDEANLVKRGKETDWKRQYKLRHNWSKGTCDVDEIPVSEQPTIPPLLVRFHAGTVYAADSTSGLRAWSTKKDRTLVASRALPSQLAGKDCRPTSLAIDTDERTTSFQRIAVGFDDGSFSVYCLDRLNHTFRHLYSHPGSSNGILTAVAYASSYLLTMTDTQLLSFYRFPKQPSAEDRASDILGPPRLLYSLKSHTVWSPLSLSIRLSPSSIVAAIAYVLPTSFTGWSVGVQELRLSPEGELLNSRLASAALDGYQSLASSSLRSSRYGATVFDWEGLSTMPSSSTSSSKPTSLSYSHPYLLISHPDNTLTLYLVTSTASALSISPGSRLWGHTSSVSGAHVGVRGKAVSVSSRGDELRVWELEGGSSTSAFRRRQAMGDVSIRITPEKKPAPDPQDLDAISDAISQRGSGLGLALEHKLDELAITRGCVGFDEENVIVLRERSQGTQALVVYDFT